MIEVGDIVEATRHGGRDRYGRPLIVPVRGRIYKVTSIYEMSYGLGCTLQDMDPAPYKGYLLFVANNAKLKNGWYFRKADADPEFKEFMKRMRPNVKQS